MEDKIYLPNINYSCIIVYDKDTIRAYHSIPKENSSINYTDYFFNSHYIKKEGVQNFYNNIPTCLDQDVLTTDFNYRIDVVDIYILSTIFLYFIVLLPLKHLMRFRWN